MKKGTFIAFLDLLATKQSLDIGHDAYLANLRAFRQVLEATSEKLGRKDQIYAFSDCAYLFFEDIREFEVYINYLRKDFLARRIYFKCAVVPGKLESDSFSSRQGGAKIFGYTFGSDAVSAYLLQERFKGVGVIVDNSISTERYTAVTSCFYPAASRGSVVVYRDIKLSFDKVDEERELASSFEYEFRKQSIRSKRIGRYYLPFLMSWISSTDFADTELNEFSAEVRTNKPILDVVLFNKKFESAIQELHGFEYVLFKLFSIFYNNQYSEEIMGIISRKILSKKSVRGKIGDADTGVIDAKTKNRLLEIITQY